MEKHKKVVSKAETHKSKLAEHIWSANGDHIPLWNEVKIIDRERFWKERKLKEAAHILLPPPKCMSQTSADLNPMWLPLLMKGNNSQPDMNNLPEEGQRTYRLVLLQLTRRL